MLIIELKVGETIRIGDIATVTLEEKSGRTARLSVDADTAMPVRKVQRHSPASFAASGGITGKT